MTPAETAFCEEMLAVCRKHGYASLEAAEYAATGDRFSRQPPKPEVAHLRVGEETMFVPKVKFVISMLGFQNLCLSRYCIESVLENSTPGLYRLILTNNGSNDGTKEYFDQMALQFPQITVIHESENTGFQAPNEKAYKIARDMGATYVVLLNNDTTVPQGWLEKLAAPLDGNEKAAISGPLGGCSRLNSGMDGCDDLKLEFIEGSCACYKISAVDKFMGGRLFSPYLSFIYSEDADVSIRAQYAGYSIHKAPFRIQHRGSQTAGAHPEAKERCAKANAENRKTMLRVWSHWNKVRRFDHPIILRRAYASGDILLATPVIRALKEKYALCPIYFETGRPEVLEGNPCLDGFKEPSLAVSEAMVIDLNGAYERDPSRHVIDSYAIAAGLEPDQVGRRLELHCSPLAVPEMANGKWCAIHCGPTTWPGKNWPIDRWNSVVQVMRQCGYRIALLGDDRTIQLAPTDYDGRGQSGVRGLAGILKRAELFIGLCSFPGHVAAALEIPSVVLYGVTDPKCFAAYMGKYRAVCSDPNHPDTGRRNREANVTFVQTDDSVMRTISVDMVMAAIDGVVA